MAYAPAMTRTRYFMINSPRNGRYVKLLLDEEVAEVFGAEAANHLNAGRVAIVHFGRHDINNTVVDMELAAKHVMG